MFELHAEESGRLDIYVVHTERDVWATLAVQSPQFERLG